jgi:hypothetical protein
VAFLNIYQKSSWLNFCHTIFLGLGFLLARGVPYEESIKIVALISFQVLIGGHIWIRLNGSRAVGSFEFFGMGFAFGTIFFTVVDQMLVNLGFRVSYAIIGAFATLIAFTLKKILPVDGIVQAETIDIIQIPIYLMLFIFLGFGELFSGSLWALVVLLGALCATHYARLSKIQLQVISILGSVFSLFVYHAFKSPILYGNWFLRPLYVGTDDAIFSESVGYSISHFGWSEYAAAFGTDIRYHWFSLAWSGLVQRVTDASPFTMTLHVVPAISFAAIGALLISVGSRLSMRRRFIVFMSIVLFATSSAPTTIRFFYVLNTSNVLPVVWTLALVLVVVVFNKSEVVKSTLLISVLIGVIILSKIPYAVAPLLGMIGMITYNVFAKKQSLKTAFMQIGLILAIPALVFSQFLSPNEWEKRSFTIDWNLMNVAMGSEYRVFLALVLILILVATRLPLLFQMNSSSRLNSFKVFLFCASLTGLIRFFVDGASAEHYFLNNALVYGSVAVCVVLADLDTSAPNTRFGLYFVPGVFSLIGSFVTLIIWDSSNAVGSLFRFSILQIAIPFICALTVSAIFLAAYGLRGYSVTNNLRTLVFVVCLVSGSVGIFVRQSIIAPSYAPKGSVATEVEIESLKWLSDNSDKDAIIATNRSICGNDDECGVDESSYLISAVAHRRVLIEGPRFVTGGKPYPNWVNDRIEDSLAFANSPSKVSKDALLGRGITWFFLDSDLLPTGFNRISMPWSLWASLEYQNENIYIFRLLK